MCSLPHQWWLASGMARRWQTLPSAEVSISLTLNFWSMEHLPGFLSEHWEGWVPRPIPGPEEGFSQLTSSLLCFLPLVPSDFHILIPQETI